MSRTFLAREEVAAGLVGQMGAAVGSAGEMVIAAAGSVGGTGELGSAAEEEVGVPEGASSRRYTRKRYTLFATRRAATSPCTLWLHMGMGRLRGRCNNSSVRPTLHT